jgi:indole-3-glycerol phosphate synthase
VSTAEAVRDIARRGIDAALVGEALMRKDDPEPFLRELVAAT